MQEFSGLIEIDGSSAGYVCITMPRGMLAALLLAVGERASGDVALADMVVEVANIVSGNARQSLGSSIQISNPTPVMGAQNGPSFPTPVFVAPMRWSDHEGHLIIALERV